MKPKRISMLFVCILTLCFLCLAHCDPRSNQAYLRQKLQKARKIYRDSFSKRAQPIRVTFHTDEILKQYPQYLEYFTKIMKAATNLMSKFIKIKRLTTANKFNETAYEQNQGLCYNKSVPFKDVTHGIDNSDLHIYLLPTKTTGYFRAERCYFDEQHKKTTFGLIKVNMTAACDQFNCENHLSFQHGLSIIMHEIIHILGFSEKSMTTEWNNKQVLIPMSLNNKTTKFLASPNVLKTAREYYNCSNLVGMPLENDGTAAHDHWENTMLGEEILSPYASKSLKISVFPIALLKDTGFYADVNENIAFPIIWGKSKGCPFVMNTTSMGFSEFHKPYIGCSEEGGIEFIRSFHKFIDVNQSIFERQCRNPNPIFSETDRLVQLYDSSFDSRCFESSLIRPKYQNDYHAPDIQLNEIRTSCHQFKCQNNNSEIKITFPDFPQDSVVCRIDQAGQRKQVFLENKLAGEISCPINFEQFCLSASCKNNCSMNGFCLKGKCTCNEKFSSEDCSQPFALLENNISVNACSKKNYANPDNACRASCPDSYFKKQGKCMPCHFSCSKCTGPSSSQCTACQFLTYLQKSKCVRSCKKGYYPDKSSKKCEMY